MRIEWVDIIFLIALIMVGFKIKKTVTAIMGTREVVVYEEEKAEEASDSEEKQ